MMQMKRYIGKTSLGRILEKYFLIAFVIMPLILLLPPPLPALSIPDPPPPQTDVHKIYDMDIEQLMNIEVVTATRTRVKLKAVPSAVYVVTAKQIRERGYRTLSEALQDIPGFDFQHTYGIFPDLFHQRGFVGNNQRSLVYIDGIPDNNISENAVLGGTIRFPLMNVERIEIVSGPVTALYGASAFNGVINIITKSGNEPAANEIQAFSETWMSDQYTGGGMAFALNGNGTVHHQDATYGISCYFNKSTGPDFSGVQSLDATGRGYWWSDNYNASSEESYNVMGKIQIGKLRIEMINWQYLQGDGTFANGTYQIDTDRNGFGGSAWDFQNHSLAIGYLWDIRPELSLDSELIVRQTQLLSSSHESYPKIPGPDAYNHPLDVQTVSGYSRPDEEYKLNERFHWEATEQFDNTLGIEMQYLKVPDGYGSYNRISERNMAGYWQGIYHFTPAISGVGGYRFDHNSSYGDVHTYRISAIATPGDTTFKAMFSTGFRAPTPWERYDSTKQRKQNPDLDPETMRSVEVGVGYRFLNSGYIGVEGYYNIIRDIILEVGTTDPNPDPNYAFWNQNRNIGKARVFGVECDSSINLSDRLNLYLNYTYSDGEYSDLPATLIASPTAYGGNAIPDIPKHKINAGVTWYAIPDVSINLRANYVGERKTVQTDPIHKVDDYIIYHANFRWQNVLVKGLYLDLLVRNLFDNRDAFDPGIRTATGEYYPTMQPISGRNIWLTVGYTF